MKILNKYILKQLITGFLVICFSLLAMLWLTQSLHFVEMVTRQGLPVYLFAEMTSFLMPRIFNILSPIAVFVTVLFVYNRLIVDRELVVMQSSGISPRQNAMPAVYLGIVLVVLNAYIMNWGIPWSEKNFRELEWQVKNNLTQTVFREGEFTDIKNGVTIFIDKHEDDGSVSGIFVSDESKPDVKVTLTAEKARMIQSEKGPRILFINGVRQELNKKTFRFNTWSFSRYSGEFNGMGQKTKRQQTAREYSLSELLNADKDNTIDAEQKRKNIVEGHRRILYPFYNLLFAVLGCVGLLVCNFNRRGQAKIISIQVICMALIMSGDLAFTNLAGRSLFLLPVLYINCILPLLICFYLLMFYNPMSRKKKDNSFSVYMKKKLPMLSFAFALVMLCYPAFAEREAGEVLKREKSKPQANMYVEHDITNIGMNKNSENQDEPINFSAEMLESNDETNVITATGDVEITYDGMRLITDKLIYEQDKDIITAIGNVKIYNTDGSVIDGDKVMLTDKMSAGTMENIKVLLKDESHVFAKTFKKKDNNTKSLTEAVYTPCDLCEDKSPTWQIYARKVQHNETDKNVYYNNAVLKIKKLPVFYTPFFTHPDPTVKRRSGLLMPTFGSSNYLGTYFQPRYFWAVNDQTNVILSPIFSKDKGVIYDGQYKQYFYNSYTSITGSYLKDKDKNRPDYRGNVFALGEYDINEYWRMTYDLKYVSDYIYLKELNKPYDDDAWLTSNIKFERFEGRNYASVDAYAYKLLSYNLRQQNENRYKQIDSRKPYVAPLVDVEWYSDPSSIGSHFKNELNTASIYHQNGSSTQRLTSINSWELPYTSVYGEKYRLVASLKSDIYYVDQYKYKENSNKVTGLSYTGTTGRFFPQAGVEWRLPFVKATENSRQIIEPVVVGVLAPEGGNKVEKIPNEDSEDVYFDDTNVLDLNRYAGYDRNDTGSRVSYGFRWNSYDDLIGRTSAFIAQSYQKNENSSFFKSLDSQNNPHFSDLVGRINAEPNQYFNLNYRYRLDKKTLDARYSEIGSGFGPSFLKGYISYIFLQGNTYYTDSYSERKEMYMSVKADLSQYWSMSVYNLRDLSSHNKRSLEHGGSLIYEDECTKWVTMVKKYNSSNPNLDNDYEYTFTFYLKTVGGFGS